MFRSFARWCHQHPWTVIGAWLAAIVAAMTLAGVVGPSYDSSFSSPESESSDGFETISEYFPGATSQFGGQLVFQAEQGIADPTVRAEIEEILVEVAEIDGVTVISPFSDQGAAQIAPDGTIAYAQLNLSDDVDQTESGEIGEELNEIVADTEDTKVIERGELRMDPLRHAVAWKGQDVSLTVTEFLLLQALAQRPGFVKSRDQLMDVAYDDQVYVDDRTIDSHIKRLRKKMRSVDENFSAIETLYGIGYRYNEE